MEKEFSYPFSMSSVILISIGNRGTSIPTHLNQLPQPPTEGVFVARWWPRQSKKGHSGQITNAWVSNGNQDYEICTLDHALAEKKVTLMKRIPWTSRDRTYKGDAFFPKGWQWGDPQPQYVAIRPTRNWPHGRVEFRKQPETPPEVVGKFTLTIPKAKEEHKKEASRTSKATREFERTRAELDSKYDWLSKDANSERKRVWRNIAIRQGQPEFRNRLLEIYERKCTISNCSIVEILEAAHIRPYDGPQTNNPKNGLLLRPDLQRRKY